MHTPIHTWGQINVASPLTSMFMFIVELGGNPHRVDVQLHTDSNPRSGTCQRSWRCGVLTLWIKKSLDNYSKYNVNFETSLNALLIQMHYIISYESAIKLLFSL